MERFQFFETFMDDSLIYLLPEFLVCDCSLCSNTFFVCVPFDVSLSVIPSLQRKPASAETSRESFGRQERHKRDVLYYEGVLISP
jgi:hypothetical protein